MTTPAMPASAAIPLPSPETQAAAALLRGQPQTATAPSGNSWLVQQHPEYKANAPKWVFARDHYSGEAMELANARTYLIRRMTGESDESFMERARLADFTNHLATVIDSIVGMMAAVETDANRVFQDDDGRGLGDPKDRATVIGQLYQSADPEGNGYLTVWAQLAVELLLSQSAWIAVDRLHEEPVIRILSPLDVTNWRVGPHGLLIEALTREKADVRTSLREPPVERQRFIHWTLEGWTRYELDEQGRERVIDSGAYAYTYRTGQPALPIFRVKLPLKRNVGYLLARKQNAIFNRESDRDHLLRVCAFPKLNVYGSVDTYDRVVAALMKGLSVLHNTPDQASGHHYIAAPHEPAATQTEVLKRKVEEFYITAFREYGDSARERTATEVRQDVSTGIAAILNLLRATLDDAENNVLWRLEQMEFPADRAEWWVSHVARSEDFLPPDPDVGLDKQIARTFGPEAVPLGQTALVAVAKEVAEHQGLPVDEHEIALAVRSAQLMRALETFDKAGVPLPAEVKVPIVMELLGAMNVIDPERVVDMADGAKRKLLEVIEEALERTLADADRARAQESQAFPGFGRRTRPDATDGGAEEEESPAGGGGGGGGGKKAPQGPPAAE